MDKKFSNWPYQVISKNKLRNLNGLNKNHQAGIHSLELQVYLYYLQ